MISGVYPSVWEVSPTVCGNVNRKYSLFPEDPQTREGDRQHAALNAMGLSGGAFQGHLCWEQTHLCGPSGHCRVSSLSVTVARTAWLAFALRAAEGSLCSRPLRCAGSRTPDKGERPARALRGARQTQAAGHGGCGVPKSLPGRSQCSRVHVCPGHTRLVPAPCLPPTHRWTAWCPTGANGGRDRGKSMGGGVGPENRRK